MRISEELSSYDLRGELRKAAEATMDEALADVERGKMPRVVVWWGDRHSDTWVYDPEREVWVCESGSRPSGGGIAVMF